MLKVIDLFAGCGGLSLGLQKAGMKVLAGLDNWPESLEVYKLNFKHKAFEIDLSDVSEASKILSEFEIDVLAGGPPCQDFSSAGKRDLSGGRADLTYSFADIVIEKNPKFFIMENVERIRKSHILFDIIDQFATHGYGLTAVVLDASYCGVPQARKRFFLIGAKGEEHNFLLGNLQKSMSKKPMSMRDYFGDSLGLEYYYRHPRNYNRRAIYSIDEPSATIRGVNRPTPPGYKLHPNDPKSVKLKDVRPLSTFERSLVQTFPKDFIWIGSKTKQEQMIGNAVPVALAEFVGKTLVDFSKGKRFAVKEQLELFSVNKILIPTSSLDLGITTMISYSPKK